MVMAAMIVVLGFFLIYPAIWAGGTDARAPGDLGITIGGISNFSEKAWVKRHC